MHHRRAWTDGTPWIFAYDRANLIHSITTNEIFSKEGGGEKLPYPVPGGWQISMYLYSVSINEDTK